MQRVKLSGLLGAILCLLLMASGAWAQAWGPLASQGFYVPPGSLDRWYAARNDSYKRLVEIIGIGDSTMQCSPGNEYSWLYQVRHDAVLSGYTNGGLGTLQSGMNLLSTVVTGTVSSSGGVLTAGTGGVTLTSSGGSGFTSGGTVVSFTGGSGAVGTAILTNGVVTGVNITSGGTGYPNPASFTVAGRLGLPAGGEETFGPGAGDSGFNASDLGNQIFPPNPFTSNNIGDYVTLQFPGTTMRLGYELFYNTLGGFTYAIDGGSATYVDCFSPQLTNVTLTAKSLMVSGLTNGTHTVRITNTGRPRSSYFLTLNPANFLTLGPVGTYPTGGALTPGTYNYAVTGVNATGETTISVYGGSATPVSGTQEPSSTIHNDSGFTSYNVYRSANGGTTWGKILNIANSGGTYTTWYDTGYTAGAAPPSTSTAGTDTNLHNVVVLPEFMKDVGLVWHNSALTGATFDGYNLTNANGGSANYNAQFLMGSSTGQPQNMLTIYGGPTSGGYKISFDGGKTFTSELAYNASPATIQTAIQALVGHTSDTVAFVGSPGSTVNGTYYITNSNTSGNIPIQVQISTAFSAGGIIPTQTIPGNGLRGAYRNPSLSICGLGINNQQSGNTDTANVVDGLKNFILLARAQNSDPLVIIPHYHFAGFPNTPSSTDGAYANAFELAEKALCQQMGCAWVNLNYALTAGSFAGANATNGTGNPHISQNGYNIEGDYVWTQVLGANQFTLTAPAGVDWTVTAPTFTVTAPGSGVSVTQNVLLDGRTASVMLKNIAMTPYPNTGSLATAAAAYYGAVTISDGLGHTFSVNIPSPAAPTTTASGRGRTLK